MARTGARLPILRKRKTTGVVNLTWQMAVTLLRFCYRGGFAYFSEMSEVLDLFRKTGALLHGHFVLRSGLHSREFFQCAILLQHASIAAHVCG
ncbi:MAG TPA: hypothetical protein VIM48_11015, partial [Chthoniobacterales bacterium]